jgi:DNA primase
MRAEDLHAEIERGVAELVEGEDWRRWLEVAARFPRYSFRNTLLICLQCPEASAVMGYRAWRSLGRNVKAGERGIRILAPCLYKRRDDEDLHDDEGSRVLRGFKAASVFDVSQTEGEPLPRPAGVTLLDGEAPEGLWDALASQVLAEGLTLERAEIPGTANGTTDFGARTVTVRASLSAAQAAKTLAHELAHVLLHSGTEYATGCRGRAEVEAESVAYVVCQAGGLVTSGYSFGYVAHWSGGDTKVIQETAERVVTCARQILDRARLVESQVAA